MTTLQYALVFDFIGWTIFGLIWMLFPSAFLGIEFGEKNYDWVTIHMTQAFGLFCIYSALPSYMAYKEECDKTAGQVLMKKLVLEIVLLVIMLTANKKYLIRFGIFGLLLCIAVNSYALIHTQL